MFYCGKTHIIIYPMNHFKCKIQKVHSALWTPFTLNMFRKMDMELVQLCDYFLCQITSWWKDNILVSLSPREVFSFTLLFLWKIFQLYISFPLELYFSQGKCYGYGYNWLTYLHYISHYFQWILFSYIFNENNAPNQFPCDIEDCQLWAEPGTEKYHEADYG